MCSYNWEGTILMCIWLSCSRLAFSIWSLNNLISLKFVLWFTPSCTFSSFFYFRKMFSCSMFFYSTFRNSSRQKRPLYLSLWLLSFLNLFPLFFHYDYLTGNYIFISAILCCVYLIGLWFSSIGPCFLFPDSAMSFLFLYLLWTCAIMFLWRLSMVQHTYMESALVPWLIFSYSELINVFCMFFFCCYFHRNNSTAAVISVYSHFTWSALLRVFLYSWCLNNIGLNCMCLFKHGFFFSQ